MTSKMNRCILLHVDFASENFQNVSYKWTQFCSFWQGYDRIPKSGFSLLTLIMTSPISRTESRLRKYEFFGKCRRIQNKSYINIHHSTRNFTLISILMSKIFSHAFKENRNLINLRARILKILIDLNLA